MPSVPGLDSDVYFGDTEKPLPDWRQELPEDDSDEPTEEEIAATIAVLGFDPSEEDEGEELEGIYKRGGIPPSPFLNNKT